MGVWIAIAIILFVIGNIMGLKPNGVDMRLDKLRMSARKLGLNPKLVACPDWVRGKHGEYGAGMIGQYTVILDDTKLPQTYYQVIEGTLRVAPPEITHNVQDSTSTVVESGSLKTTLLSKVAYTLDNEPLQLPIAIEGYVKAVYTKANSIVVFWEDVNYVKPITNPDYDAKHIESDLNTLKLRMQTWAEKIASNA